MARSERNPGLERVDGRLSKSAAFRGNPQEYKAFRHEKGQPGGVGLVVLVEGTPTYRKTVSKLALLVTP
jgi:hypothetical protein